MAFDDQAPLEADWESLSRVTASGDDPRTLHELEEIARKRLPAVTWTFYSNGADNEQTLSRNMTAYDRLFVLPRVLRDVSVVDTSTQIFGRSVPFPLAIAPSAMQKLAGGDGELDVARAAVEFGLTMGLSSASTTSLEDVIACGQIQNKGESPSLSRFWFQLYLTTDMDRNQALIKRAESAGYEALIITVDAPVLGNRLGERKNPVVLPPHLKMGNFKTPPGGNKPSLNRLLMDARTAKQAAAIIKAGSAGLNSAATTWDDVSRIRKMTNMKIILKGVVAPEDAELAVQRGADAIIVSNHGGRQLDCTVATIEALPGVVAAVKGRIPVMVDSGIRRGSDIFKALCLGADLVLIGRPVIWGLAFGGQSGVKTVLDILEREFSRTMALAGVNKVTDIDSSYLRREREIVPIAKL